MAYKVDKDGYEEVPHHFCGDCVHFAHGKPCKRIDHKTVKFAIPWFKSYDQNQHNGVICSDFSPANWMKDAYARWPGFEEYWSKYVENWLPYGNTNVLVYFTLHGNTKIRYGVPLMDFVNGTMIEGNILKAVEREYYRRSKNGPYKLVHEPIDGVEIVKEYVQILKNAQHDIEEKQRQVHEETIENLQEIRDEVAKR